MTGLAGLSGGPTEFSLPTPYYDMSAEQAANAREALKVKEK